MPKRSARDIEVLTQEAFQLLADGHDKKEVAQKLGVTVRTVQRWTSNKSYQQAIAERQLIAAADGVVVEATSIEQQVTDLFDYRDSQRFLALEMGSLASRVSQISKQVIERLEENPEEVSPRLLPQLLRAVAELSEKASSCWARATGLEEVLDAIQKQELDS